MQVNGRIVALLIAAFTILLALPVGFVMYIAWARERTLSESEVRQRLSADVQLPASFKYMSGFRDVIDWFVEARFVPPPGLDPRQALTLMTVDPKHGWREVGKNEFQLGEGDYPSQVRYDEASRQVVVTVRP